MLLAAAMPKKKARRSAPAREHPLASEWEVDWQTLQALEPEVTRAIEARFISKAVLIGNDLIRLFRNL